MPFLAATSGLAGLAEDAREFLAALRFARPDVLWLVLVFPAFALLDRWAGRQRRRAVERIGRPSAVAGQLTHPPARGRWAGLANSLAWTLLILGVAGPLWGKSDETGVAVGRDVVVVIDLSRTMLADDMDDRSAPMRWQAARAAALDLIDAMARRGGHRVGVVVFAARTAVLCPLTTDYDHARAIVKDIKGDDPPVEIRPPVGVEVLSGTRIGAALLAAVGTHDKRFPGHQDIVLLSDGDDPGADSEWVRGADAARDAKVPVHAVGIGDPAAGTFMTLGDEPFETRLQEAPLKQVAAETRGQYLGTRTGPPRLGEFFRSQIEPLPGREVSDEAVPQPKERYPWCLAPALALFALGWFRGRT
ncbi:VWA domain-containing protein [Gemmata sp.]|uniref:VWA domain-containing protein n=1 Tax=Gemmata sp. TaxID=1914242 RepID=UPI003F72916F